MPNNSGNHNVHLNIYTHSGCHIKPFINIIQSLPTLIFNTSMCITQNRLRAIGQPQSWIKRRDRLEFYYGMHIMCMYKVIPLFMTDLLHMQLKRRLVL